jgi:hypothetical protein
MKRIIVAFALFALAALAQAQTVTVPAGSPTESVYLTWTAAAGCTAATPCTYAVYRVPGTATITGGTTGATLVTTTAAQALTATDSTVVAGQTYSYAVETVQGGMNSVPSNTVTLAIPLVPSPPVLSGSAS